VFSQVAPDARISDGAASTWYGEWARGTWAALEEVPLPTTGRLWSFSSSGLVLGEHSLAWAAIVAGAHGGSSVVFFERSSGHWTTQVVTDAPVNEVALTHSEDVGFVLAAHGPEAGAEGTVQRLRVYTREGEWKTRAPIDIGGLDAVRNLSIHSVTEGIRATWLGPGEDTPTVPAAWTAVVEPEAGWHRPTLLDSSAVQVLTLHLERGVFWLLDHRGMDAPKGQLRLLQLLDDRAAMLTAWANPYTGFMAATPTGQNEALLVGPRFDTTNAAPLASLPTRVRLRCP